MKIVAVSLIDAVYREHGYIFIDKGLKERVIFFGGDFDEKFKQFPIDRNDDNTDKKNKRLKEIGQYKLLFENH